MSKRFWLTLLICVAVILLAACQSGEEDAWDAILASGKIRVGLDPTFPPFENGDTGDLHGIDVDLAREIGQQLGLEVEFIYHGYDGLYDALQTGQVDLLVSALVIDPQKTKLFAYSEPYFNAGQFLVIHPDRAGSIDIDQLQDKTLAVEIGSEGHVQLIEAQRVTSGLDIKPLPTPNDALWVVLQQEVDGAIVDQITARLYKQQFPDLLILPEPITVEPFAIVTRTEDEQLLEAVDDAILSLESSGQLDEIVGNWLD